MGLDWVQHRHGFAGIAPALAIPRRISLGGDFKTAQVRRQKHDGAARVVRLRDVLPAAGLAHDDIVSPDFEPWGDLGA